MYIDIEKNEYPLSVLDIQSRNPMVMSPEYMEHYRLVKSTDQPDYDVLREKLVEVFPIYNEESDEWVQCWEVENLPDDIVQSNIEEDEARKKRDSAISVTRRQALLALFKLKRIKDTDVELAIDRIEDEDLKYMARVNWSGALVFENHSEFVEMVAKLLDLTNDDLDDLFKLARTL